MNTTRAIALKNSKDILNLLVGGVSDGSLTDAKLSSTGIKQTVANNTTNIQNKIKTMIFTATVDGTTNIVHNLPYVSATDELLVYYMYNGGLLVLGDNYTEDTTTSILLSGWSINTGEHIKCVLYKSIK